MVMKVLSYAKNCHVYYEKKNVKSILLELRANFLKLSYTFTFNFNWFLSGILNNYFLSNEKQKINTENLRHKHKQHANNEISFLWNEKFTKNCTKNTEKLKSVFRKIKLYSIHGDIFYQHFVFWRNIEKNISRLKFFFL